MERRKYLGLPGDVYVNSELCAFYLLCIIRINCVVLRLVMMSYKAQEPLGGNIAYGSVGCAAWELLEEHSWSTADVTFSERRAVIHTVREEYLCSWLVTAV